MRLLADQNIPQLLVNRLRDRGHDVLWILAHSPGASDEQVLATANAEKRVLLTLDRDFGELVFHRRLVPEAGILLLRLKGLRPPQLAAKAIEIVESRESWSGLFAVADPGRLRIVEWPTK